MRFRLNVLLGIVLLLVVYQLTVYLWFREPLSRRLTSLVRDTNSRIYSAGVAAIRGGFGEAALQSGSSPPVPPAPTGQIGPYAAPKWPHLVAIATAVRPGEQAAALGLVGSVRTQLNASLPLVLWDLGLGAAELAQLAAAGCPVPAGGGAPGGCSVRRFPFELYPEHVGRRLYTRAYKPFALISMLRAFGTVVWSDLGPWPVGFSVGMAGLRPVLAAAKASGLQAWTIPPPTAALTHPQTFSLLGARPSDYLLHRMVAAAHLALAASPFLHDRVLLPWSRCALRPACWHPPGSGRPLLSACRFDARPYFRYSGCHLYDTSALNVVLGAAYRFNVSAYACARKVFGYGPNDTDPGNHFSVPGLDFAELTRSALPDYA